MTDELGQVSAELDGTLNRMDKDAEIARGIGLLPDVLAQRLNEIETTAETKAAQDLDTWANIAKLRGDRARGELAALPPSDPLLRLKADELQRAGQLRPWVAEQVALASPALLRDRLESALARRDRAEVVALAWEVERRRQAEADAHGGKMPRAWQDLDDVLERAEASFTDVLERGKRTKLQQDLDAATRLQMHVDAERLRLPSERRRLAGIYGLRHVGVRW